MGWIEFIKALPVVIKLIYQIIKLIKGNPSEKFVKHAGKAFKKVNDAKNQSEKHAAARDIQQLISKL